MNYLKDKKASFYLMIVSAVLALISLTFYSRAVVVQPDVKAIVIAGVVLTAVMAVLAGLKSRPRALNLCATVIAVVLAWGLIQSVNPQLDSLGWWISGLYTFEQVKGYIYFAVLLGIAVLLDLAASFIDLQK